MVRINDDGFDRPNSSLSKMEQESGSVETGRVNSMVCVILFSFFNFARNLIYLRYEVIVGKSSRCKYALLRVNTLRWVDDTRERSFKMYPSDGIIDFLFYEKMFLLEYLKL